MQLSARQRFVFTWLMLGGLAAAVCSLIWPAAHIGGEVIPVGHDSFYHARRILDTAADPSAFYEFDPKIHVPEGSQLVWPWGYDYAMGWIVRIGMTLGLAEQPIAILVWLPVVAVFASIGLTMLIARRMGLALGMCALAAVAVALSPLTQYLHGVGFVDHHFAEYIMVLLTVLLGLRWLEDGVPRSALLLGLALGLAPAIHNALFILQIPLLICLAIRWLNRQRIMPAAAGYFSAGLLAATLAVLLPSQPFQQGRFEYFYLSWFHLYVAGGTALYSLLFSRLERRGAGFALLIGAGVVLLLPLLYQITAAGAFLSGKITLLYAIGEMQSPLAMLQQTDFHIMSNRYSLLLWLLPLSYGYCAFKIWQERCSHRLYYWISAVLGLSLLLLQFRLHYFGTFALCIPLLVAVQEIAAKWTPLCNHAALLATCLVLGMFVPPMRHQLLGPMTAANDPPFLNIHESLQVLADACRRDPGVVLADNDMGHYIRYFTDCSVIADNFLLTRQHEDKVRQMERLFTLHAADLPKAAPFVKYVVVRPLAIRLIDGDLSYVAYGRGQNNLIADLLLRPFGTLRIDAPPVFDLLYSTTIVGTAKIEVPYLALYKVRSDMSTANPPPAPVTQSNLDNRRP